MSPAIVAAAPAFAHDLRLLDDASEGADGFGFGGGTGLGNALRLGDPTESPDELRDDVGRSLMPKGMEEDNRPPHPLSKS